MTRFTKSMTFYMGHAFSGRLGNFKPKWQVVVPCVPAPPVGRTSLEDNVEDSEAEPGLPGRESPD